MKFAIKVLLFFIFVPSVMMAQKKPIKSPIVNQHVAASKPKQKPKQKLQKDNNADLSEKELPPLSFTLDKRSNAPLLSIKSYPSGAKVTIDNAHFGFTPVNFSHLLPGQYRVVFEKDGFYTQSHIIDVVAGDTTYLNVSLKKATLYNQTNTSKMEAAPPKPEPKAIPQPIVQQTSSSPTFSTPSKIVTMSDMVGVWIGTSGEGKAFLSDGSFFGFQLNNMDYAYYEIRYCSFKPWMIGQFLITGSNQYVERIERHSMKQYNGVESKLDILICNGVMETKFKGAIQIWEKHINSDELINEITKNWDKYANYIKNGLQ